MDDEPVTRRRFVARGAHAAGAVAVSATVLPVIAFAVGPVFDHPPARWQVLGPLDAIPRDTYEPRVITETPGIGEAGKTTVYVRRRDPAVDTGSPGRGDAVVAISSRCAHVGCPVSYKDAARAFVCPCHGGVYDFRGRRIGGPPARPLDRFATRVRADRTAEIGPRFSVNSQLRRFAPRYPGESLDGIGPAIYPPYAPAPR